MDIGLKDPLYRALEHLIKNWGVFLILGYSAFIRIVVARQSRRLNVMCWTRHGGHMGPGFVHLDGVAGERCVREILFVS